MQPKIKNATKCNPMKLVSKYAFVAIILSNRIVMRFVFL